MPVYVALGNNDSGCADYQLDPNSAFLRDLAPVVASALPPSDRAAVLDRFPVDGAYSVSLAPALPRTRLIVLNDLFFSRRYRTCAGADDPAPAAASLAWLRQQLVQAQRSGQRVWFMAHIPPGVDPYSTVTKFRNVCAGESPVSFLSSEGLAEQLVQSAPIVRLAIFAHTHMDELRLLTPPAHSASSPSSSVAVKLVPSISPVDGNNPSFTVARIDPATAVLQDYQVIAASNQTGIGTTWSVEYDYGQAYHEAQFSPHALAQLIAEFENDPHAQSAPSDEYVRHYFVGQSVRELTPFWPQYVCSLAHDTAAAYRACVCSNTH